jgi:uncharacterized membrane protein
VALIGLYLIFKGFGVEDIFVEYARGFGISTNRVSFIFYTGFILFFILSIIIGAGAYASFAPSGPLTAISYGLESFLLLFPVSLVLYLVGRIIDLENKRLRYRAINQGTYTGYAIISIMLLYLVAAWIIGQIYFWQLLAFSIVAIILGYLVSILSMSLKKRAIDKIPLKDKNVVNEIGAYIGKIINVDKKRGMLVIKTDYGNTIRFDIDRITNVSDRVMVR